MGERIPRFVSLTAHHLVVHELPQSVGVDVITKADCKFFK